MNESIVDAVALLCVALFVDDDAGVLSSFLIQCLPVLLVVIVVTIGSS